MMGKFKELNVWKEAKDIAVEVYSLPFGLQRLCHRHRCSFLDIGLAMSVLLRLAYGKVLLKL